LSEQEKEEAKRRIQRTAFLEFRLVHPESDKMIADGLTPVGYTNMTERVRLRDGTFQRQPYLIKKTPEKGLTGKHVKSAGVIRTTSPVNPRFPSP